MSNLDLDNIRPSAGGTYRNLPRGVAAAWSSFTTVTTTAVYESLNISSLTDNGTGDTSVNFTSAFSGTALYSALAGSNSIAGGNLLIQSGASTSSTDHAAGQSRIVGSKQDTGLNDFGYVSSAFFGDLA